MIRTLFSFLLLSSALQAYDHHQEYKYLDEIALRTGADKGSYYHNYTEIYCDYFAPLRDKPIKFLEIGIYQGASVKMWEDYLPFAQLHFIDITLSNTRYYSPRAQYHLCDQEAVPDLEQFISYVGGNFDVILDDGGHKMNQQITSFVTLFPYLKSGGMYIIEDLHTSYWKEFGATPEYSTVNYLKTLIDDLNKVGAVTARASHLNIPEATLENLSIYQKEIRSIHFYDSVAIILKR